MLGRLFGNIISIVCLCLSSESFIVSHVSTERKITLLCPVSDASKVGSNPIIVHVSYTTVCTVQCEIVIYLGPRNRILSHVMCKNSVALLKCAKYI